MLDKIFSVGNRKIIAMVLGLVAILFGDKLGIVMTDEMNDAVVQMVAVFTGGNVLSKFAFALLNKTGAVKLPQLEEAHDIVINQGSEAPASSSSVDAEAVHQYASRIAQDTTKELQNVHNRIGVIEQHLGKTTKSVNDLIALINQQVLPAIPRSGNVPPQGPVPTPNQLYNQG